MFFLIKRHRKILLSIFLLALVKSIFFSFYGFGLVDEGQSLHNSLKIFSGALPYRDFFAVFTPLHYYIYALPLALFDSSLIAPRIFQSLIFSFTPVLIYLISLKFSGRYLSLIPAVLIIFLNVNVDRLYFLTFILFGVLIYQNAFQTKKHINYLFAGLIFGIAALFRLDLSGIYFLSSILVVFMTRFIFSKKISRNDLTLILIYILGFSIPLISMLLWFFINGIFSYFVQNAIIDPILITKRHNIPFPLLTDLIPIPLTLTNLSLTYSAIFGYSILITYVVSIYFYVKSKTTKVKTEVLYFIIAGLLAMPYLFGRSDMGHFVKGGLPFLILITWILSNYIVLKNKYLTCLISLVLISIITGAILESYFWIKFNNTVIQVSNNTLRINGVYPSNSTLASASTINIAANFLRDVPEEEKVLILPYMAGLYFLSDKVSPLRFDNFLPGYITDSEQDDIIRQIIINKVKYVVYDPINGPKMQNFSFKSNFPKIDLYLMENYNILQKTNEGWLFLIKK